MRKLFILATFLLSLTIAFAGNDKITKDTSVLPTVSRQFLSRHFAKIPVSHIKIEKALMGIDSYDVILTDGTNVEFNRKGEWKEVKRHKTAIPAAIVPKSIREYVKKHYPSAVIIAIDKDSRNYEVDLNNKTELKFNLKGKLTDIDID